MKARVLVIEDNRALAENVAEMLEDEGVEVETFGDAESASQAAQERGFDLAIVDIRLTGNESGLELVPRLRRYSAHGEIVLMTGNATLHSAIQAIRRGVYAYIPKPFEAEQLVTLVKNALAQVALKQEKQALTQRLSASEVLYRGVVDTVEACILGLDREGLIRFGNRFASERLGLSQAELSGRAFASLCEERLTEQVTRTIARAVAGETIREHECTHARGGRVRTMRWTLTPLSSVSLEAAQLARDLPLPAQSPVVLAVGIDITDRIELERKSAEAEAMAAMGTLTTSLAHEIRNPLNAAKLQLELLIRRAKRTSDQVVTRQLAEPAELVRSELDRLSVLLDEFLNLARPRQLLRQTCSVAELLDAVIKLKEPLAQSAGITLTSSVNEPELTMRADADKLKQVIINLVGNAIEALAERGHGSVELRGEPNELGGVTLSVIDDGPGVSPELLSSAFRPFVTSKQAGTGLGLAIVQKIVAQHGGEVQLLPRPGGGTIARFTIPA
jgi:PAS domain S-box-containing protein